MNNFNRYQLQFSVRKCVNEYNCFVPNFDNEQDLFRIDDEPVNIVDNSANVSLLQNFAQQTLVDVSGPSFDTSIFSDEQLAAGVVGRQYESSDLEDIANGNLSSLYNSKLNSDN